MVNDKGDTERANTFERFGSKGLLLSIICAVPVFMVVFHFAGLGRARAAALCMAVNVAVAILRWNLRRNLWFWCAILLMFLLEVVILYLVPFGDQSIPAYGLLPAAVVIYLFDEAIIFLLSKLFATSPK